MNSNLTIWLAQEHHRDLERAAAARHRVAGARRAVAAGAVAPGSDAPDPTRRRGPLPPMRLWLRPRRLLDLKAAQPPSPV